MQPCPGRRVAGWPGHGRHGGTGGSPGPGRLTPRRVPPIRPVCNGFGAGFTLLEMLIVLVIA
ncbi:MAG: prepilin-type N-terminal cleavage/methylation domain-containing protein, partial [Methylococcus sp.]